MVNNAEDIIHVAPSVCTLFKTDGIIDCTGASLITDAMGILIMGGSLSTVRS